MRIRPELKSWARVHVFRASTALLTILLLGVCFLYRPELLKWYLRESMGLIEMASGMLPYPWGDQIEIVLREIGGSVWFQITLIIILVRMVAWTTAVCWRRRPFKRRSKTDSGVLRNTAHKDTPSTR
jgi:hypothetical protein